MTYVITYDIGTTGMKTCLFSIDDTIHMLASASKGYRLNILNNGGAEQDEEEWWEAMCSTTKELIVQSNIKRNQIAGISFCSQMQGLVLVDKDGKAIRRPMSYMDHRARKEHRFGIGTGFKISGLNARKLIHCLLINGGAPTSVKDPLWKYKWVQKNEPENFQKVHKWLDVKEYMISRCTGKFIMTKDTAYSTFLYDTKRRSWSTKLTRLFHVDTNHLPEIVDSTDNIGGLTSMAAKELGLDEGTPVFGGGGDATLIGIGTGCVEVGDTHIYSGTSGWVSTIVDKQVVDVSNMIAAICGVEPGKYNYFAEMETAGKCLEWVKDHLALDEIGIYLEKKHITEGREEIYTSLYDYLTMTVKGIDAGGVIFTPWLHGNRCPFEDPYAGGMFFNIHLDTGKTELIRAVLEGVCYHLRWMLECEYKKIKISNTISFAGGGALSDVTCQILSDILKRDVKVVSNPQNVGAVGAASVVGVGLGIIDGFQDIKKFVPIVKIFTPNTSKSSKYDKNFEVFKKLYYRNKANFRKLNIEVNS